MFDHFVGLVLKVFEIVKKRINTSSFHSIETPHNLQYLPTKLDVEYTPSTKEESFIIESHFENLVVVVPRTHVEPCQTSVKECFLRI